MRGKILKRAIAAALVLTFVSGGTAIPQISQVFGSTVLTANAEGYELPFVPAHTGYYHFTVTNNTDYVTVTWNGQAVTNGMDLTDAHSVIMTADNPFIWTVGNSVNTATKNSSGQYRVSLSTTSDVTIDAYTPSIAHDNGYARETTIYLKPENFTQGDYFYYDKSIPAGTLRASVSEGTVSFSTIMDTPVAMYDELGNTITLTQEGSVYSFEPVDGTVYYLVRTHIAGTESNWDGNETPMMPVGSVTTSVVKHDNGAGSEEDVELTSANFDYVSKMFSTDKSFADGEIINLLRDPSSATGLIMVQPGISVSVYTAINGNTVQLTKLANSDNTSDNYTFPIMEAQSYYVVKNYVAAGFTVTWLNEDGTVLETDEDVAYGTMPCYDGEEPKKAVDAQFIYTFKGWNPELTEVTGDAVYTAVFEQEAIEPLADHSDITAEKVAVNEALTVQCQAEGGVGEYEYSVYVKRAEETSWTTKQSKGTNPNVVVSFAETGMHDICVKIKDSSGMIVKKYFKVNVVDGTFANTSGISAEQAATHETITVHCSAQGGSGAYTYSVYTKRADETSWTTRQSKGTNTDVDVSFAETGLHDICVKTVDYSGMVVKKYFRVNITAGEFANTTTLSVRKEAAGEAITVNCSAQGGSGTYKYSVYTKGTNDTAWKTKQNYKTNEVVSLTFDDPGVYQVCVKVKDDTNTVVKSYFTVRITENT